MASITRESNGRKTIQFVGTDRKRHSLRLGKASLEYARTIKNHVESIMAAQRKAVSVSAETADPGSATWTDDFHEQLEGVGLVEKRVKAEPASNRTIGTLIAAYNADRLKAKPGTRTPGSQSQGDLVAKFGRGLSRSPTSRLPTLRTGLSGWQWSESSPEVDLPATVRPCEAVLHGSRSRDAGLQRTHLPGSIR